MSRNPHKLFLALIFAVAVAFCSGTKTYAAARPVNQDAVFGVPELPHQDLREVHQHIVSGGPIVVQKNIASADLMQVAGFHQPLLSFGNFLIKASSLLLKDFLGYIYPSHNLW